MIAGGIQDDGYDTIVPEAIGPDVPQVQLDTTLPRLPVILSDQNAVSPATAASSAPVGGGVSGTTVVASNSDGSIRVIKFDPTEYESPTDKYGFNEVDRQSWKGERDVGKTEYGVIVEEIDPTTGETREITSPTHMSNVHTDIYNAAEFGAYTLGLATWLVPEAKAAEIGGTVLRAEVLSPRVLKWVVGLPVLGATITALGNTLKSCSGPDTQATPPGGPDWNELDPDDRLRPNEKQTLSRLRELMPDRGFKAHPDQAYGIRRQDT